MTVDAPISSALVSVIATFTPVTNTSVIKSLPAVVNVTLLPALVMVVIPPIERAPDWVIAPPAVTDKVPPIVNADKSTAVVSTIVTLARDPPAKLNAPPKLFEVLSRVIVVPAVTVKVDVPAPVVIDPDWVIFPVVAVAVNVPPTDEVAKSATVLLTTVALSVPLVFTEIVPGLATASVSNTMAPLVVVAVRFAAVVPVPIVNVPLSVIPIPLNKVKSPSTVDAAIIRATVDPPLIKASALFPVASLVVSVTAPVKALVVESNVMVALSALVKKVDVPVTVNPVLTACVIFPVVAVTA